MLYYVLHFQSNTWQMGSLEQEGLAELYVCPACNHDFGSAYFLREHLGCLSHRSCLNQTGRTLEQLMQSVNFKKWKLTNKPRRRQV